MREVRLSELPRLLSEKRIKPDEIYPIEVGVASRIYTAYMNATERENELKKEVSLLKYRIEMLEQSQRLVNPKIIYG